MCNSYTHQQICLMNRVRQLWGQHVYWTRFFIISTASDLGDLDAVSKRLLRNPKDFAKLLAPLCGKRMADRFEDLFYPAPADCGRSGERSEKRRRR